MNWFPVLFIRPWLPSTYHYIAMVCAAVLNSDDEFEKWQREVRESEAVGSNNGSLSVSVGADFEEDDHNRPSTPPEGEEEFVDDDGTRYKWDRGLRAWVPQVSPRLHLPNLRLYEILLE